MNILAALILGIAGISCLIYFRKFGGFAAKFMAKRFQESYGDYATEREWDNPNTQFNKYFYRGIVLFFGIFLLIMSFHEYFGVIHINS